MAPETAPRPGVRPCGDRPGHGRRRAGCVAPMIGGTGSCREEVVGELLLGEVPIPWGVAHTDVGEVAVPLGDVDVGAGVGHREGHLALLGGGSQSRGHGRIALE